eukprot:5890962-Heterocapsa_arctica.AAC.1
MQNERGERLRRVEEEEEARQLEARRWTCERAGLQSTVDSQLLAGWAAGANDCKSQALGATMEALLSDL